jgi:hypothetical protein
MPSRRALYAARLLPWVPWWLWVGLWGTFGVLLSEGLLQDGAKAALYLLIGAQVPWVFLGACGTSVLASKKQGIGCLLCLFCLLMAGVALHAVGLAAQALGPYLVVIPPAMLLLAIGLFVLQLWLLDRVEPMWQIDRLQPPRPVPPTTPVQTPPAPVRSPEGLPSRVGPIPLLAGRHGLGWAAASYALSKFLEGGRKGYLRRSWAFALLFCLVLLMTHGHAHRMTDTGKWFWFVFLLLFKGGSVLHLGDPQRLYLLGVDYRCQLRHFLKTFWMTPALLAILLGALLSAAIWGQIEMPLAVLAVAAGMTLLRAGWGGWPGFPILVSLHGGRMGCWSLLSFLGLSLWTAFLVGAGTWIGLPEPGWDTVTRAHLFAAACGLCGAVFLLYKWMWLTEARMAEAMQILQQTAPVVRPADTVGS